MVEYRNSNKYQSSISDSRINFHSEVKENEFSQTFKLAKESLIISKLELKFEKMKKHRRNKLEKKFCETTDHGDEDQELDHNLPNISLRANKNQLLMNISQPNDSIKGCLEKNQTPSQSEANSSHISRLKMKSAKSTNLDCLSKDNIIESCSSVNEKFVNTENNIGFNKDYKLEELILSNKNLDKCTSKFKSTKVKSDTNKPSNLKSENGKDEKARNGVKFNVEIPIEQKEKKINLYLQSNLASNNTSHNTSNKSINSNNYHINQETKHTSTTVNNAYNGVASTLLDNKSKKDIAVKVNSEKSVLPNVKSAQDQEEKELKRNAHVRKRSTSCFAFLCG